MTQSRSDLILCGNYCLFYRSWDEAMVPHLNGRQRRLYLDAEAQALGHGGIIAAARAAVGGCTSCARAMVLVGEIDAGHTVADAALLRRPATRGPWPTPRPPTTGRSAATPRDC
ncbi:hypothetical protein [Streptomyces sasae]|uniref:hypothetical protein n=1 Tax=Streptomyces sasae TaxID=1266772 RepID=UPI00292D2212|nr:hypothetical protein [Streptomyces sasae]